MFYDLLVHVDLPDESRFVMALGNINNYLAALNGEPCTVVLLANGGAARFLARKDNAQTEAIEKLAQAGVSFRVCANAMKKVPITKEDLLPLRRSRARRRRGNRPPPTRRLRLHQAVITKTAGASLS